MATKLSSALIAEFVGTFALIFIGAGAGALGIGGLVGVAFAHGLVIVAFAYAYGHISGTHINPAVTIGLWVGGQIEAARAVGYIVVQILGGIVGAMALRLLGTRSAERTRARRHRARQGAAGRRSDHHDHAGRGSPDRDHPHVLPGQHHLQCRGERQGGRTWRGSPSA